MILKSFMPRSPHFSSTEVPDANLVLWSIFKWNLYSLEEREKWEERYCVQSCCCSAEVQSIACTVVHCSRSFQLDISCLRRWFPLPMCPGWQCSKPMGLSLTIQKFCIFVLLFLLISQKDTHKYAHYSSTYNATPLSHVPWSTAHPAITRHGASSLK